MVKSDILLRVFLIGHKEVKGTAFTIEEKGQQFLITAKHLFEKSGYPATTDISLMLKGKMQNFTVEVRYPEQDVDIAVIKIVPFQQISPSFKNKVGMEGLILGQDMFFLGFPYNYEKLTIRFPEEGNIVPFIKKACLSGILNSTPSLIILDGYNNPGFSGLTVCFYDMESKDLSIAGVVSGYRFEEQSLYEMSTNNEMPYYIKENTGLVLVAPIHYALNVIRDWE